MLNMVPLSAEELALMRRIDELHLIHPFAGARMLSKMLKRKGSLFGRRRVATLMKRMGIHAIYRKPSTSIQSFFDRLSPYLTIEPAFSAFKTYGKGGLFFLYSASQSIDVRADHGIIITHEAIGHPYPVTPDETWQRIRWREHF